MLNENQIITQIKSIRQNGGFFVAYIPDDFVANMYNNKIKGDNMLKLKIFFTVFIVYEIIAIILLHNTYTCNSIFSMAFCYDSGFKYFLFCIALPLLGFVAWMWINEIFVWRYRRRSWIRRSWTVMSDVTKNIKSQIGDAFNVHDVDKYLASAILFGLKKYSSTHPQIRRAVQQIINNANNQYLDDADDYDDADYDSVQNNPTEYSKNLSHKPRAKFGARIGSAQVSGVKKRSGGKHR